MTLPSVAEIHRYSRYRPILISVASVDHCSWRPLNGNPIGTQQAFIRPTSKNLPLDLTLLCAKIHAFIIKGTIHSPICQTISREEAMVLVMADCEPSLRDSKVP